MKKVNPKKPRAITNQKREKKTKPTSRRGMARVVHKFKMDEQGNDFAYWQTRSYAERISALEEIRSQYNLWRYGNAQPRLGVVRHRILRSQIKNLKSEILNPS